MMMIVIKSQGLGDHRRDRQEPLLLTYRVPGDVSFLSLLFTSYPVPSETFRQLAIIPSDLFLVPCGFSPMFPRFLPIPVVVFCYSPRKLLVLRAHGVLCLTLILVFPRCFDIFPDISLLPLTCGYCSIFRSSCWCFALPSLAVFP